jgi:signal transduction histidine kinase
MQLQKELFTFEALVNEIKLLAPMTEECQLHYPLQTTNLYSYKSALIQMLLNLVINAIQFNDKPQKKIELCFSEDKRFYHFTVKDNGMGIALIRRESLFEVFHHPEAGYGIEANSYGIGLNTVKRMVEKLGGTIEVSSQEGIGSSFRFSIKK